MPTFVVGDERWHSPQAGGPAVVRARDPWDQIIQHPDQNANVRRPWLFQAFLRANGLFWEAFFTHFTAFCWPPHLSPGGVPSPFPAKLAVLRPFPGILRIPTAPPRFRQRPLRNPREKCRTPRFPSLLAAASRERGRRLAPPAAGKASGMPYHWLFPPEKRGEKEKRKKDGWKRDFGGVSSTFEAFSRHFTIYIYIDR